jgi:predicted RNase H-like HicB family nuclease
VKAEDEALTRAVPAIIERYRQRGWLVTEVAELPACSTQAPDSPHLDVAIQEAIGVYLETEACLRWQS